MVINWHLVCFLERKLGKSTQPLAHAHSFRSTLPCISCTCLGWCQCYWFSTHFVPLPQLLYIRNIRLPFQILNLIKTLEIIHFPLIFSFQPKYTEHLLCIRNCARCWAVKKKNKPWSLPLRGSQSRGRDKYKRQLQNSAIRTAVDIIASSKKGSRLNLGGNV